MKILNLTPLNGLGTPKENFRAIPDCVLNVRTLDRPLDKESHHILRKNLRILSEISSYLENFH